MAGHSKWSKVKRSKGALDVKRGQLFSRLSREISVAARDGGGDPDLNARLRLSINAAKAQNMPGDTIERAIKKGAGEIGGASYEHCLYEGYGAGGIALMIEVLTENRNRAAADMRSIFKKNDGSLGTSGSVAYLFDHRGELELPAEAGTDDRILELALEAGAENVVSDPHGHLIITLPDQLNAVATSVRDHGLEPTSLTLAYSPRTAICIDDTLIATQILKLYNALDDYDDSLRVFSNFDIPDSIMEAIEP